MYIKKKKKKKNVSAVYLTRIDEGPNGISPIASSGLIGTLLSSPLHECQISEKGGGGGGVM